MTITVARGSDTERKVWEFWASPEIHREGGLTLRLQAYREQVRETKRHGWKDRRKYVSADRRSSDFRPRHDNYEDERSSQRSFSSLPVEDDFSLPSDVMEEARQALLNRTSFRI